MSRYWRYNQARVTQIYHITHFSNLVGITAAGRIVCDRAAQRMDCVRIGYPHIKARRLSRPVPLPPGGFVGDYVPFYFAPRSPMLFVITKGSVPGYLGGQSQVVHLVSNAEEVDAAGCDWVFTDGHAAMSPLTSFYNDFADLIKIDWAVMSSKYWHDTDTHPDRERRRQAEFLIHDSFPWGLVSKIAVRNQETAENVHKIIENVIHRPTIAIETGWYY